MKYDMDNTVTLTGSSNSASNNNNAGTFIRTLHLEYPVQPDSSELE